MTIATMMQVFSVLLAPAAIDAARRTKRLGWLDGMVLVWTAVIGAAFLWTVLVGLAFGEPLSREMIARGILCGVVAVLERWMRTVKGRGLLPAIDPPDPDAPAALSAPADILPHPPVSSAAPTVLALPAPDLDFSGDPKPSVKS